MSDKQSKTYMTPADASRIQSSQAKQSGGQVQAGSFAAKAQSAAQKNVNTGKVPPPESKGQWTK